VLSKLVFDKGAQVSLSANDSETIDIRALLSPVHADVLLEGRPTLSVIRSDHSRSAEMSKPLDLPASEQLEYRGHQAKPAVLSVRRSGHGVEFSPVNVDQLSLFAEATNSEQQPSFVSSVQSGHLTLPDSGAVIDLNPGDEIRLKGAEGRVSGLRLASGEVDFSFDGQAREVSLGSLGSEQNLNPSVLEYLYFHNFKLFWAVVVVLGGLLLSMRKRTSS